MGIQILIEINANTSLLTYLMAWRPQFFLIFVLHNVKCGPLKRTNSGRSGISCVCYALAFNVTWSRGCATRSPLYYNRVHLTCDKWVRASMSNTLQAGMQCVLRRSWYRYCLFGGMLPAHFHYYQQLYK